MTSEKGGRAREILRLSVFMLFNGEDTVFGSLIEMPMESGILSEGIITGDLVWTENNK